MKHLRYMAEMLRKNILGDALQDAWRFIRNHMACIFKGHPGWDTSETDYFCIGAIPHGLGCPNMPGLIPMMM
jgi:hypothetical protein